MPVLSRSVVILLQIHCFFPHLILYNATVRWALFVCVCMLVYISTDFMRLLPTGCRWSSMWMKTPSRRGWSSFSSKTKGQVSTANRVKRGSLPLYVIRAKTNKTKAEWRWWQSVMTRVSFLFQLACPLHWHLPMFPLNLPLSLSRRRVGHKPADCNEKVRPGCGGLLLMLVQRRLSLSRFPITLPSTPGAIRGLSVAGH